MKEIVVYTTSTCPYCSKAKSLLQQKNVRFDEVLLQPGSEQMMQLVQKTRHRTVPQIFIGEDFIGGCNELEQLINSGEFDNMLC